jgi:hypothetical protein
MNKVKYGLMIFGSLSKMNEPLYHIYVEHKFIYGGAFFHYLNKIDKYNQNRRNIVIYLSDYGVYGEKNYFRSGNIEIIFIAQAPTIYGEFAMWVEGLDYILKNSDNIILNSKIMFLNSSWIKSSELLDSLLNQQKQDFLGVQILGHIDTIGENMNYPYPNFNKWYRTNIFMLTGNLINIRNGLNNVLKSADKIVDGPAPHRQYVRTFQLEVNEYGSLVYRQNPNGEGVKNIRILCEQLVYKEFA